MNRIDRLTAILVLLQTRRVVRAEDIAGRFGISRRTVYRDLRALEEAGVPIGAEAGIGYYLAEGYHLPPVMFTREEAGALAIGGKLIEKFSDVSVNRYFVSALDKIKAVLGMKEKDYLQTLDSLITVLKAAPAERSGFPDNLMLRVQAELGRHRVIRMDYRSGYRDEETRRDVEPLGLCFYSGNWHLLAWCRLRNDYRDFRVDRILAVTETGERFDRGRHPDLFALVERIVLPTDVTAVTVRFTPEAARQALGSRHYFGFVEEYPVEGWIEMHFLTPDTDLLARWLMGFIDRVEVISPESLIARVQGFAERLHAHYHPSEISPAHVAHNVHSVSPVDR